MIFASFLDKYFVVDATNLRMIFTYEEICDAVCVCVCMYVRVCMCVCVCEKELVLCMCVYCLKTAFSFGCFII
eukprot:m.17561 g.17561  ORF g.17561 m.17561 type:complete len:73 (+) comp8159_c0_seq3:843-1061(+)